MSSQELIKLFEQPASINSLQTSELENILEKYPYFQAARAVYLKGLYSEESFSYNHQLKIAAAYSADRSVLFDFITSREFTQDKVAQQIKKQEEHLRNITVFDAEEILDHNKSIAIDKAIKMRKADSDLVMDPDLFEKPAPKTKEQSPVGQPENQKEHSKQGTPLHFDSNESHSFSEWLRLTSAKPIERNPEKPQKNRDRKFELIDNFISKSPKISPTKSVSTTNMAQERLAPPEALMTETLARVYLEQKNYKKATQAYKILILKNPEKSGFFADQIRAIKKLQENNTSKE